MIDFYFYLTASIGIIVFGISKGGFAGPVSVLAIPVMSLSMSPITAAGILLPILLVMDFLAIYIYWNKWDINNIYIILPPAITGIFIGGLTFHFISSDSIRIIIGLICILFIILSIFQKNNTLFRTNKIKGRFWSLISGLLKIL